MSIGPISGASSYQPDPSPSASTLIAELQKYAAEFNDAVNNQDKAAAQTAYQNQEHVYQQLLKIIPSNSSVTEHITMYLGVEKGDLQSSSINWLSLSICSENKSA